MRRFSSLSDRLFLAMALLAVTSIGAATYYATAAVTAQAEGELRRGLHEAGTLVEEYHRLLLEHFSREAKLVADLPLLKAAVGVNDPPTLRPIAEEYQRQLGSDVFVVTNPAGRELASLGSPGDAAVVQVVSVPIYIGQESPEILGTLSVGFALDARAAARFKALTNSEVAFAVDGAIQAATLPPESWPALSPLLVTPGATSSLSIGGHDYVALSRALPPLEPTVTGVRQVSSRAPAAIILRSRTDRLAFLSGLHRTLLLMALAAVLAATLASYAIARTVTRPLRTVTQAMREMAATGDLTRRIPLPGGSRWEDEDARLLAASFNSMTDSIARFQREGAQRERLSSLGRLSTVVAHEIRNPLMIIKTSLRALRQGGASPDEVRTAVADIDEEVARLDHIVAEVLDFARPIRFSLERIDLNAVCADAARAVSTGAEAPRIAVETAADLPPVVADPERLRLALVNVLTNASHAATAAGRGDEPHAVRLSTHLASDGRARIVVRDRGAGIAPDDLPRIFDPFFTTRRTGTGLGLAITRNIVEGLGGTITIGSTDGRGTDVQIDLPTTPEHDVQRHHPSR
jgi:signal transduction histidine kinase